MKKLRLFQTIVFLSILALLTNCKEIEEVTPEPVIPTVNWTKLENNTGRLINGKVYEGKLLKLGVSEFFYDLKLNEPSNPQSFREFLTRVGRYKAPFNDKILGTRTETDIFIFPSNDISLNSAIRFSARDLDENFKSFEDIPVWRGDVFGITNLGTVLVPYRAVNNGIAENTPFFFLFNTAIVDNKIEIVNFLNVKNDLFFTYQDVNNIQSFESFFLVQIGQRTFKIDNIGSLNEISTNPMKAFKFGNEIRSLELDRAANEFIFKKADLNGNNWQTIGRFSNEPALRFAEFIEIDNRIIGFEGIDVFELVINGNNVKINYLQNNNLEGGSITSISLLNSNTIVLTTNCISPSTNCGIFTKSLSDFLKPRPSE
jgi:hypothetical protein